jgi:uncharacterized protein YdeI (YjbR/CyaY-like superfamily)
MSIPEYLEFADSEQWRTWLKHNHAVEKQVWVLIYKKKFRKMGLSLDPAIEQALCYGWIDSTLKSIDERCYALRFSPRGHHSPWSISNINRVAKLIAAGKMTSAGLAKISEAKENGEWEAAIQRENTDVIPDILLQALQDKSGALKAYQALTNSRKKQYIYWLQNAKREDTRNRRIQKIIKEILE